MKTRSILKILCAMVLVLCFLACMAACNPQEKEPTEAPETEPAATQPSETTPPKKPTILIPTEPEAEPTIPDYDFSGTGTGYAGDVEKVNQGQLPENYHTAAQVFPLLATTGRTVLMDDAIALDWSNASFTMAGTFDGEVKAKLNFIGGSNQTSGFMYVIVDEDVESPRIIRVDGKTQWYTLGYLEKGEHTIRVVKVNEAQMGVIDFLAFEFNGTLIKAEELDTLKIEFIGDSITCGADMIESAVDKVSAQDGTKSYAALTAETLGAEASFVSASGYRLTYCDDGNTKMVLPGIYTQVSGIRNYMGAGDNGAWNFAANPTDVVVVNLGTNDSVLVTLGRGDEIKNAATVFLKTIRKNNPDAIIVWCYGAMLKEGAGEIQAAIQQLADPNVYYLDVTQNNDGLADHPNAAGHERIAQELTAFLLSKLS